MALDLFVKKKLKILTRFRRGAGWSDRERRKQEKQICFYIESGKPILGKERRYKYGQFLRKFTERIRWAKMIGRNKGEGAHTPLESESGGDQLTKESINPPYYSVCLEFSLGKWEMNIRGKIDTQNLITVNYCM